MNILFPAAEAEAAWGQVLGVYKTLGEAGDVNKLRPKKLHSVLKVTTYDSHGNVVNDHRKEQINITFKSRICNY